MLTDFRKALEGLPIVPTLKALMCEQTGDEGWLNLRPPLDPVSVEEARDIAARLPTPLASGCVT